MNVLNAIANAQFIPTAPIYMTLTCRLPFNHTILTVQHLRFRGMHGRLLFQQLGTNSHVIVGPTLENVSISNSTFTQSVAFILLDAKLLTPEELPTVPYPPLRV